MRGRSVPEGFHTVTPYLLVGNVRPLLQFLKDAFNAEEVMHAALDDGTINHAQVKIGDSMIMIGQSQAAYPPMPSMLYVYVDDVDVVYAQALKAGGESQREPTNEPYGDRAAGIQDAFGNQWWLATPLNISMDP